MIKLYLIDIITVLTATIVSLSNLNDFITLSILILTLILTIKRFFKHKKK
jgi:hypothetical protein